MVAPDVPAAHDPIVFVLRTLADPTRFRIYHFLRAGEACVCEIAQSLGLAENLVSHHLAALRRVQLVRDRHDQRDARWVYYQLDQDTLRTLSNSLGELFDPTTIGQRIPTCGPQSPLMPGRKHQQSATTPSPQQPIA